MEDDEDVIFYVNGPARLLMSCVIADELYPKRRKHLILVDQFGYNYDHLLPHVRARFDRILTLKIAASRYSHLDQLSNTYFNRFPALRRFVTPGSRLILFGIRSPAQKYLIRRAKALGNRVDVYAESVSVDRYFANRAPDSRLWSAARRLLSRAFENQHDYDRFYVLDPEIYRESPHYEKLAPMFDLYGSRSFRRYAELLTRDIDLSEAAAFDTVLLGQPLSNFDGFLLPDEEREILKRIVGDRRVLVLPHPNEQLDDGVGKYDVLSGAQILRAGVPSELLLLALMPTTTITYSSTASLNYAMMNQGSENYFYPIFQSRFDMLVRYKNSLPNIFVSDEYVTRSDPNA